MLSTAETGTPVVSRGHLREQQQNRDTESSHNTKAVHRPLNGGTSSIAFVIGFLKGKSAVGIHRKLMRARRVKGLHFWSRGYCVSTVGLDERTVREYIRHQEEQEKRQLSLELE